MVDRLCVMQIGQDFVAGVWDVECFCGWSAETAYDEREDAVRAWEAHRA